MSGFAGILSYAGQTWQRRHFWLALARLDLKMRYRGSVLGIGWSLFHPLATTGIYCLIFGTILHADLRNYIPFILSGLAAWNLISSALMEGCQSIRVAERFMRVYPAPVAIYGLRTLCGLTFHFFVILGITLATSWILLGFGNLIVLPWLIPAIAVLILFCWSVIMIFGIIDVYFPDNKYMMQIVLQLLFYTVPIILPLDAFARYPAIKAFIEYNPLSALIMLIRDPIVNMSVPAAETWMVALGTTLVVFTIAMRMIQRTERYLVLHL
jgi:lipopolysaccharide transport system permease protein